MDETKKYRAFISYSHADEAWAGWLQKSLERFRAPRALAYAISEKGGSARLTPIFRDREDLPVAGNLNTAIQNALAQSDFQIVICSPNSAKSKWVNEEIKLFHRLHGPGKVFAVIIAGEPNASAMSGRADDECFPPALRVQLDKDGGETALPAEPLAADAREDGDGKRFALLKVAAGILGVGLDDLVRRDAQRRARRAWAVTGASLAGAAAASTLAIYASAKNREADIMRGKAEDLIEFMITDLREKLVPLGSLDVLESVGDRALDYYADQDLGALDDDALARRAKAVWLLGKIDQDRNDLDAALIAYENAEATTRELLRRAPANPDRIFDHAQNVFYVGEIAMRRYDKTKARSQTREYLRLAERLIAVDGANPRSQLELAYATNMVGTISVNDGDYDAAIDSFTKSASARKTLLDAASEDPVLRAAYAYAISWQAFAEMQRGEFRIAADLLLRQLEAYGELSDFKTGDYSVLGAVVTAQRRLAESYLYLGDTVAAWEANEEAGKTASLLLARDARNANWVVNAAHVHRMKSYLAHLSGDKAAAITAADQAIGLVETVLKDDAPQWYAAAHGEMLAWRALLGGSFDRSVETNIGRLIDDAVKKDVRDNARFIAYSGAAIAGLAMRAGEKDAALAFAEEASIPLDPLSQTLPAAARMYLIPLYRVRGKNDEAEKIAATLEALGVRHPDFVVMSGESNLAATK